MNDIFSKLCGVAMCSPFVTNDTSSSMDNWRMCHKKRFNNLFPKKKKKHLQKLEYVIIIYIYIKNISSYLFKNQFLDVLVKF